MRKTTSKLLSVLLAVVLLAGMLPMTAHAADPDTVASWNELITKYDPDGDKTITINTTVLVTDELHVPTDGETYTLTGGGTLKLSSDFSGWDMIVVGCDYEYDVVVEVARLTLANVTLDGAGISTGNFDDLVYVAGGEFTMTGGKITNSAGEYGGVFVGGGVFNVSGGATVTGNKSGGAARNVYLSNSFITITDELSGTIGITASFPYSPAVVAVPGAVYTITTADLGHLKSDGGYALSLNTDGVEMIVPIDISYAEVTLEGVDDLIYSGKTQKPTAVIVDIWNDNSEEWDTLVNNVDYTWKITSVDNLYNWTSAGKNAGVVEITITGKGKYTGTTTVRYYIDQAELTIDEVTVKDWVYGSESYPVVESVTFGGLVNNETLALYTDYFASAYFNVQPAVSDGNAVGGYAYLSSSAKARNYTFDYDNYFDSTCTVTPAALTGVVSIGVTDNNGDGTINVGDQLLAVDGTNDDSTAVLTRQWYRNGVEIADATSDNYFLTAGDVDGVDVVSITFKVTATGNYTGSLTSTPVVVGMKPLGSGVLIGGSTWTTGDVLTLNISGLNPAAVTAGAYTIQWYRDGAAISGATNDTYTLANADLGKYIAVVVTGTGDYTGTLSSSIYIWPTAPDEPVLTATAGNGQVTLKWATPFDGGSPLAAYALSAGIDDGGYKKVLANSAIAQFFLAPTATSYTVTGLTNGTEYTFMLAAMNSCGFEMSAVSATPTAGSYGESAGGGSSASTVPAADGGVQVDYTQSGGNVTLSLPASKLDEIIEKSEGTANFDLTGVTGATAAVLPKAALSELAGAGLGVEFDLPQGTVTLDSGAAESVAAQATGTNVSITVNKVAESSLTSAQREAVKDGDVVFDISIMSGAQNITAFEGTLTVTVPYDGPLPAGVWYLNSAGELEQMACAYDPVTKTVTFKLTHLSLYVVGQDLDAWVNPFTDVKEGDWFYEAVKYANLSGLFSGTTATTFSPNATMTRGMMVTVLWRLAGSPDERVPAAAGGGQFSDVAEEMYYYQAVNWAAANGIVKGAGENLFDPGGEITREQMAAMLLGYAEYAGLAPEGEWAVPLEFVDTEDIADWAIEGAMFCNMNGIITGKPGNLFDPRAGATRAEVAAVLMRFAEAME